MARRIDCKNEDGIGIHFEYDFTPFFLLYCEGVTSIYNNVVTSENTMIDGSTYQGSTTKERFIEIGAQMCSDYRINRDLLYKVFKPKATGTFTHTEDGEMRTIDYKVESIEIDDAGVVRDIVVSLRCPDPFFQSIEDTIVDLAVWEDGFEWEHEFHEEGEEFGTRTAELIKEIPNDSAAANIGITVLFTAVGPVSAPAIYHMESGDFIIINTFLNTGDMVMITTGANDKEVYFYEGGDTSCFDEDERFENEFKKYGKEVNWILDEDSEFMQLGHGKNTLRYTAATGIDYLDVCIRYRFRFLGV